MRALAASYRCGASLDRLCTVVGPIEKAHKRRHGRPPVSRTANEPRRGTPRRFLKCVGSHAPGVYHRRTLGARPAHRSRRSTRFKRVRRSVLIAHRLLRKDEDAVAIEGCVDLGKDLGHHRTGQIDAAHLGAEGRVKRGDARSPCRSSSSRCAANMRRDSEAINLNAMPSREIRAVVDWLIDGARSAPLPQQVLAQLSDRLVACGIPLWRVAVFVRTLHPQVMGRRFIWRPGAEVEISEAPFGVLETAEFLDSPVARVYRDRPPGQAQAHRSGLCRRTFRY